MEKLNCHALQVGGKSSLDENLAISNKEKLYLTFYTATIFNGICINKLKIYASKHTRMGMFNISVHNIQFGTNQDASEQRNKLH